MGIHGNTSCYNNCSTTCAKGQYAIGIFILTFCKPYRNIYYCEYILLTLRKSGMPCRQCRVARAVNVVLRVFPTLTGGYFWYFLGVIFAGGSTVALSFTPRFPSNLALFYTLKNGEITWFSRAFYPKDEHSSPKRSCSLERYKIAAFNQIRSVLLETNLCLSYIKKFVYL